MNKLTKFMMSMLFILMLGCSIHCGFATKSSHLTRIDTTSTSITTNQLTVSLTENDSIGQVLSQDDSLLFANVFNYISQVSKRNSTERNEIAKTIINIALENDIDICFILAQGTIETHLGTTGIGRTRKSIFGVYKTYPSYEACINDYARILKKRYLTRGRNEHDLMKHYVTTGGARYAGSTNYEVELKKKYLEIKSKTNLHDLQVRIKKSHEI